MGLTKSSTGVNAIDSDLIIKRNSSEDIVIALAGNPNVGKSTVFNALTGMKQHTGNWPGKTVCNAQGFCQSKKHSYIFVDMPGTYSLLAHSAEEEVARNFICFGESEAVVVVCDATCLERNLNLVLQTMEICNNVIVCVNLLDEAKRKNININLKELSKKLGTTVVGTVARKKQSLKQLLNCLDNCIEKNNNQNYKITYPLAVEKAISFLEPTLKNKLNGKLNPRWLALKLLDPDKSLLKEINEYYGQDFLTNKEVQSKLSEAKRVLQENGISQEDLKDIIVTSVVHSAEEICKGVVTYQNKGYNSTDRKIDEVLTSKRFGYLLMILLLSLVFWITISGANYPSTLIADFLFYIEEKLNFLFEYISAPVWLQGLLVSGVYKTVAWVTAVMLPPMAIFFPLFTLLEDIGYLPRIAYNLDKPFKKCNACGKQALTMCMGFGCNAAGVVGCRIIDSKRERLLAMLTNSFVPCNGRFPTIISIITMFFVLGQGFLHSVISAGILTFVIILGIIATFVVTKFLSITVLKGVPSSYILEMPPYRKPQILKVIVRSIFDRTLFVLGRSICVAAPAGALIWILANITVNGTTLLNYFSSALDPIGTLMGLDGVILMAFILGLPANEIVIPITVMTYMAENSLTELSNLTALRELFVSNGWTVTTAICVIVFSLFHWPCSTTLITIKKESGSLKWAIVAAILPTALGILLCIVLNFTLKIFL